MINLRKTHLYYLLCLLTALLNVAVQNLVFEIAAPKDVIIEAMFIATFVSLLAKYTLDKQYIFDGPSAFSIPTFVRYTFFGGCITLVVFSGEYVIWRLTQKELARDAWVITALLFGYWVKYQLDLRYTFVRRD